MSDFLGIDVGASGLRVFSNTNSAAIAVIDAPNSSKNREQDVISALRKLHERAPQLSASRVCLGMSGFSSLGVSAASISREIRALFSAEAVITSDMVTSHYAHFGEADGVTVVIGTGALAFGIGSGKFKRIDGLGASLGDFGSAYWIGLRALRSAVRDSELKGDSELMSALEEEIGTAADWPRRFAKQELSEFQIASLSRVVSQLAQGGNRMALAILSEAGSLAAESAIACAKAVATEVIGYGGSVLLGSESVKQSFLAHIEEANLRATELKAPSGVGALQLAVASHGKRLEFLISEGLAHSEGSASV